MADNKKGLFHVTNATEIMSRLKGAKNKRERETAQSLRKRLAAEIVQRANGKLTETDKDELRVLGIKRLPKVMKPGDE